MLAICRGLQLVNVARGGTLQQHLPESLGTERYRIGGGVFAENQVAVAQDTALAAVLGEDSVSVRSYHHQGIDRLGEGLVAAAHSDDGLVQAFVDTRRRSRGRHPMAPRGGRRGPAALPGSRHTGSCVRTRRRKARR